MVCPNCDKFLEKDEQLIIHSVMENGYFMVDHVVIYSQPDIRISKQCSSKAYETLRID